jgi:catechol 2,3-dioxygenase-like lactoylglutathione lyase family enzyme
MCSLTVEAIDHIVVNVRSDRESAAWYGDVLGMACKVDDGRMSLHLGTQKINLRPVTTSAQKWFTARDATAGSADLCFLTRCTPEEVVAHLKQRGVAVERGPVDQNGARGILKSIYCRDPDGNLIEIASYVSTDS